MFFSIGCKNDMPLSCRDWFTYRFLKHQGFSNVVMTGCPAWYDLDFVDKAEINVRRINKICVSEPARYSNIGLLNDLLYWLRSNYKSAAICLVIHRENKSQIDILTKKWADILDVKTIQITGGSDGFNIYNDADLHIGFRVHAHIYNLSRRNFSILINEDIRGRGVNHALGLDSISIDKNPIVLRRKKFLKDYFLCQLQEPQNNILKQVEDIIDYSVMSGFRNYRDAFLKMNHYFKSMENYLEMINSNL